MNKDMLILASVDFVFAHVAQLHSSYHETITHGVVFSS